MHGSPKPHPAGSLLAAIALLSIPSSVLSSPAGFLENRGQWDPPVRYRAAAGELEVYVTDHGIVIQVLERQEAGPQDGPDLLAATWPDPAQPAVPVRACAVRIAFESGAGAGAALIEARDALPGRYHFLRGRDPDGWRTDVRAYEKVVYRDVRPGLDLAFRLEGGRLLYETRGEAAGAAAVDLRFEGAATVDRLADGTVRLRTPAGSLRITGDGRGGEIAREAFAGAERDGGGSGAADRDRGGSGGADRDNPGALLWGTFLGTGGDDLADEVDFDTARNPVIVGLTSAAAFPVTPGSFDTVYSGGDYDAYVAKLSSSGNELVWCTFLGGSGSDRAWALALDTADNPVLAGDTGSDDFPTTPGSYDPQATGGLFITKLAAGGDALVWSTYIEAWAICSSLVLDADANPIITGWAHGPDYPTTPGAYDETHNGGHFERSDPVVTKLAADGSHLVWSTFLGGAIDDDFGWDLAVSASGRVAVTGFTYASDYPTSPGAFDRTFNGEQDAFVTVLDPTGSELVFSSFLGGGGFDNGYGITFDAGEDPIVVGGSFGGLPTTPGAFQGSSPGGSSPFVTKFAAAGDSLIWSTYCGGSDWDRGMDVETDGQGNVVLVGNTDSDDFPTTPDGYDTTINGRRDGFLAKVSADGCGVLWGSFFGGANDDWAYNLGLSQGTAFVVAQTRSPDYPATPGAIDPTYNGAQDAAVTAVSLIPLEPCFHLDFDEDGDPYTLRTELPADVDSAAVRFVLEVPADNPRGEFFRFDITEDCCEDSQGTGYYGIRVDPASVSLDPARVAEYEVVVPLEPGCAGWAIEGRFSAAPMPPPGNRIFFGGAAARVECGPFPPGCEMTHDFETTFHVFGGSSCERGTVLMSGSCVPAAVGDASGDAAGPVALGRPYPVPAGDRVRIDLRLREAGRARVAAYDAGGRRIALLADRAFPRGTTTIEWTPEGTAAGVYFIEVEALGARRSRTVVVKP